jgi:hypothetical protein
MAVSNSSVLIISDTHFPFAHPDTLDFLRAVAGFYKPDRVIHIGDEIDAHAMSFHTHDPDLLSPSSELELAIKYLKVLYRLFPVVDVMESNHGSLVYRRAKAFGIPKSVIKSYREMLEAPIGWKWHKDLVLTLNNGSKCYFCHSKGSDILRVSQSMGMSVVSGHEHSKFEIRYWGNPLGLYFGMVVGCLIDDNSLAYSYNKLVTKRPVIGIGVIVNGFPILVPMVLNNRGRWNRSVK